MAICFIILSPFPVAPSPTVSPFYFDESLYIKHAVKLVLLVSEYLSTKELENLSLYDASAVVGGNVFACCWKFTMIRLGICFH